MSATIIFVDPAISHLDRLLDGLDTGAEAIVLDGVTSATAQIADALQAREAVGRAHVIAHGAAGEVSFASGALSLDTLDHHDADLQRIRTTLRGGDILLWSCNSGEGARGEAFVTGLARATGSRVGASTGLVGSAAKGGHWTLDCGEVGCEAPLTAEGRARASRRMLITANSVSIILSRRYAAGLTSMTIQDAIDHAVAGDTIQIGGGTHTENVIVNKALTIQNAPGETVTVIGTGGFGGAITVNVGVNNTTIRSSDNDPTHFVLQGAPSGELAALYVAGSNSNTHISSITTISSDLPGGGGHNSVITGGDQHGLLRQETSSPGNAAELVYVIGPEDVGPSGAERDHQFHQQYLLGQRVPAAGPERARTGRGQRFLGQQRRCAWSCRKPARSYRDREYRLPARPVSASSGPPRPGYNGDLPLRGSEYLPGQRTRSTSSAPERLRWPAL